MSTRVDIKSDSFKVRILKRNPSSYQVTVRPGIKINPVLMRGSGSVIKKHSLKKLEDIVLATNLRQ